MMMSWDRESYTNDGPDRQGRATRGDYVIIADYCHYCGHPQAAAATAATVARAAGDGKKIKTELETDRQMERRIERERERDMGTGKNLITSPTAM